MGVSAAAAILVFALAVAARVAIVARTRARTLKRLAVPEGPRRNVPLGALARVSMRPRRRGDLDVSLTARAMARALRGGLSPVQAIAAAGGLVPHDVATAARVSGLSEACAAWRSSDERPAIRLLTTALEIGAAAGGSLARALDTVADTVDSRSAVAREMWAQAATARASAAVLVIAPIAFSAFALVGDRSALAFLTGTPAGVGCLATAAALDVAGAWWMAKITAAPS